MSPKFNIFVYILNIINILLIYYIVNLIFCIYVNGKTSQNCSSKIHGFMAKNSGNQKF